MLGWSLVLRALTSLMLSALVVVAPVAARAEPPRPAPLPVPEAGPEEALDQKLGDRVRASAEFTEGVAAFREKRPPRYE